MVSKERATRWGYRGAFACVVACASIAAQAVASLGEGSLDRSFSDDGIASAPGEFDYVAASDVARDGSTVIVGRSSDRQGLLVVKFNRRGALDEDFGDGGSARIVPPEGGGFRLVQGVAFHEGGVIVAGGVMTGPDSSDAVAVRLKPNGSVDRRFGANGFASFDTTPPPDEADQDRALAIEVHDGRIHLLAGGVQAALVVARLTDKGRLDRNFGVGGLAATALDKTGAFHVSEGGIVVAGQSNPLGFDLGVVRLARGGSVRTQFGEGGYAELPDTEHSARDVTLDGTGRTLVATYRTSGSSSSGYRSRIGVARLTSEGELDAAFGTGGLSTPLGESGFGRHANGVHTDSQGRVLLTGSDYGSFLLVRLDDAGALDNSFGSGGVQKTSIEGRELQSSDSDLVGHKKIVLAGTSYGGLDEPNDGVVARYRLGPSPAR